MGKWNDIYFSNWTRYRLYRGLHLNSSTVQLLLGLRSELHFSTVICAMLNLLRAKKEDKLIP